MNNSKDIGQQLQIAWGKFITKYEYMKGCDDNTWDNFSKLSSIITSITFEFNHPHDTDSEIDKINEVLLYIQNNFNHTEIDFGAIIKILNELREFKNKTLTIKVNYEDIFDMENDYEYQKYLKNKAIEDYQQYLKNKNNTSVENTKSWGRWW
jgi:hypothetical protein